ncbi:MAG: diacylglycerol/lipid kinase family protein [Gemmatimonadaceae bacterium]
MSIPAIVNPAAGNAAAASAALGAAGFDVREVAPAGIEGVVRSLVNEGARRIVVAGGDGTIGTAASVLAHSPCELAVIPGGTLNHFAKDHGIPEALEEAVQLAATGVARPVDVATVSGRIFLNTSTVGAYVAMVRQRELLERHLGYRLATVIAAFRSFLVLRAFDLTVEIEGTTRRYRTPLLFVGVGERELRVPILGGRLPEGKRALHLLVPRSRGRRAMLSLALAAFARGTEHVSAGSELDAYLVDRCTVVLRRRGPVGLDGEIVRLDTPLEYRLLPGALSLVTGPTPRTSV